MSATSDPKVTVRRRKGYTVVPNDLLVPGTLDARSWGIFIYLYGRPDDWECRVSDLRHWFKNGRDAIYTCLNQLAAEGYILKEVYFEQGLRRVRYVVDGDLLERDNRRSAPDPEIPDPGSSAPDPESQDPEIPPLQSTGSNKPLSPLRGDSAARTPTRVPEPDPAVKDQPADDGGDVPAAVEEVPAPPVDAAGQDALPGVPKAAAPDSGKRFKLPEDWEPSARLRGQVRELGLSDAEIDEAAVDFRRYWRVVKESTRTERGWNDAFRNWAHKEVKNGKTPKPWQAGLRPLADADAETAAQKITKWWWDQWERRGPILDASRTALEQLVRTGLEASLKSGRSLTESARLVQAALKACERPVPHRDVFQRALVGDNPNGFGPKREVYTGERWKDGSAQAAWAAWGRPDAAPAPGGEASPAEIAEVAEVARPEQEQEQPPLTAAPPAPPAQSSRERWMSQWNQLTGGGRDAA